MDEVIWDTSIYFDNTYEDDWINSDFAKKIIKEVDKSDVISSNCIQSPVLGQITPLLLSEGTKTLLLMNFDDSRIYNASKCGNNCAKYILEVAKSKDLTINLMHTMDFGNEPFEIKILNTGRIVHNIDEYLEEAFKFV
jgi:poly-gamma-glutamate capsule biosynthesis protein CapA/YwtB (metallophosphatase superfamily)